MTNFLIIGSVNTITYKEVYPLIQNNKLWFGFAFNKALEFSHPNKETRKIQIVWYTNISHNKHNNPLILSKIYNPTDYPHYDNYDGIDVSRTANIPMDYDGVMGVPITFLDKYCPEQFEIVKFRKGDDNKDLSVNGKCPYFRILIKRKKYEKKFIIIGSDNARTYKETFPLLKENKMWIGINHIKDFVQPDKSIKSFGNISWFTNMEHSRRNEPLDLYKKYSSEYPKYDNYDAIEVSKVADIPMDYDGVMGVPISFLDKYCPTQFEIIGLLCDNRCGGCMINGTPTYTDEKHKHSVCGVLNGKRVYPRILIKRK